MSQNSENLLKSHEKCSEFHLQAICFLNNLFRDIMAKGLYLNNFMCDHICYRVASLQEYEIKKRELEKLGNLLTESIVSSRKIATYKLFFPIYFTQHIIDIVELPEPKQNNHYKTGFEHVEFVIDKPFEDFANEYSHLEFDFSDISKPINPELRLQISQNTSIKFHHQTLESVIAQEFCQFDT